MLHQREARHLLGVVGPQLLSRAWTNAGPKFFFCARYCCGLGVPCLAFCRRLAAALCAPAAAGFRAAVWQGGGACLPEGVGISGARFPGVRE